MAEEPPKSYEHNDPFDRNALAAAELAVDDAFRDVPEAQAAEAVDAVLTPQVVKSIERDVAAEATGTPEIRHEAVRILDPNQLPPNPGGMEQSGPPLP